MATYTDTSTEPPTITTGTNVDVPWWVNATGWLPSYTWSSGCGVVARQNATPYGNYYYAANGSDWGNPTKTYGADSLAGLAGQSLTIRVGWAAGATGGQSLLDNVQLTSVEDTTAPSLTSFVDDKGGGPIFTNEAVTYTVTFSEAMRASMIDSSVFENAYATAITINSVTPTGDPAAFLVVATPTQPGTLRLQVKAGATLKDLAGVALDTTSATPDDTVISVTADTTPPTLTSFVDSRSGGPVVVNLPVTYTVTFSELMKASTVEPTDFENASTTTAITVNSVTPTGSVTPMGDSATFLVAVTPTAVGTLQLQVRAGAALTDPTGNALNTAAAIPDDTTVTVTVPPPGPPVADYARWFDASTLGLPDNGAVTQWNDGSVNAAHATVPSGNAAPVYVANAGTATGLPAVYFAKNGGAGNSGALRFTRDSAIRTVFSVFKGNSFLLTDAEAYHFHRATDDNPADPLWDGNASANIRGGSTYVNGTLVNGTTFPMPTDLHNGFNLVEVLTNGNPVQADSFNKDRIYHAGNQFQTEVIIYDRVLDEAECLAVEDYLMAKWFATTPQAKMTSFGTNVSGSSAVIDPVVDNAAAIAWTVPFGTDVTTLAPDFALSPGATCTPASGSTQDFTAPVVYTVTSSDAELTTLYTVTVTVAEPLPPFTLALSGDSTTGTLMENGEADGYRFQTGDSALTVNWLGLYDAANNDVTGTVGDGLLTSHRVSIWQESDGVLVAQTTVLTTDALAGNFRGHHITPVTLDANTGYVIAADYGGTGDRQWEGTTTAEWGVHSGISNLEGRYGGPGGGMPTGGWGVMVGPNFGIAGAGGGTYSTWADANGIPGEPASGDFDNDGMTNLMEYALGRDPKVSSQPAGVLSGKVITFTKGADAIANGDVSWVIEESSDLGLADPWASAVTQPAGDPALTISYTLPDGAGKVFARLKVTKP